MEPDDQLTADLNAVEDTVFANTEAWLHKPSVRHLPTIERDLAQLICYTHERTLLHFDIRLNQIREILMSGIDDLTAAANRIVASDQAITGVVDTLRAAVQALQDEIANSSDDTSALEAIAAQLNTAADAVDQSAAGPTSAPAPSDPVDVPPSDVGGGDVPTV